MQNKPGTGPTRPDKTAERMAQERQSPGATTAGGHGGAAPSSDASPASDALASASTDGTFANSDMRRGDAAAAAPIGAAETASREERIRQTAYRLSQNRNDSEGDPVSDWLKAEAEIDALDTQRSPAAGP